MFGMISKFFGMGGGYEAAIPSDKRKSRAWVRSHPADEDRHAGGRAMETIRLEARDLDRNQGLLFGVLNRIADYSVPSVLPQFETGDAEWNAAALLFLSRWFLRADVRQLASFDELIWTAVRQSHLDGDGAFLLLSNGQIQPIEAELICNPATAPKGARIVNGVELDASGGPVAFWICQRDFCSGLPNPKTATRYEAANVVFYRHFYRFDAVRGVPPVASIVADLIDQSELHRGYVAKVKHDAKEGGVVEVDDPAAALPGNFAGLDDGTGGSESSDDPRPPQMEDDHLRLWFLRPGEKVSNLAPATPSASIVEYEKALVRYMSSALGIPAEFWTLDLTGLSWSTANAVVKLAGDSFRKIHRWAVRQIINPILSWRLLLAIRDGDLPPPPVSAATKYAAARSQYDAFRLPAPEYLWANEREHVEAAAASYRLGMPALDRLANERGLTVSQILDAREKQIEEIYARCKKLSERIGTPISPSQFLDVATPGAVVLPPATSPIDTGNDEGKTDKTNEENNGKRNGNDG